MSARLDEDELVHLAIEASAQQRHGDAIGYLKEAVAKSGANFKTHYLLGAQHAQIGMTERAIADFGRAIELEPDFPPARFQLGLLLLCNGRADEALATWEPLERLEESDAFLHFARGLRLLCRDAFAECRESLQRGIALNRTNAALNADMQRVLDEVARAEAGPKPATEQPGQILLSAYTRSLN